LVFPPISISGRESVTEALSQLGPKFDILTWMNSSKQESRVHAVLDSDLKSLVSVQFEVISSFWLNFPPAIDDVASVKRCFRLSKVAVVIFAANACVLLTPVFNQALRDQWDRLIAFASKNQVLQIARVSSCSCLFLFHRLIWVCFTNKSQSMVCVRSMNVAADSPCCFTGALQNFRFRLSPVICN
jgi:hypothetical protein